MDSTTYDFYTSVFRGDKIPESSWAACAREAGAYLNRLTFGRLAAVAEVADCVRLAACAVAEVIHEQQQSIDARGPGVKSESLDGYSVAFEGRQDGSWNKRKREAADLYFPPSDPLRYAGVELC